MEKRLRRAFRLETSSGWTRCLRRRGWWMVLDEDADAGVGVSERAGCNTHAAS